ncbi:hypothetical protein BAY59_27705 [Prauserella coralliicola]|nr:hypothetical protein BAY59_27705 [Prauserella coralliicola]
MVVGQTAILRERRGRDVDGVESRHDPLRQQQLAGLRIEERAPPLIGIDLGGLVLRFFFVRKPDNDPWVPSSLQ